ncbi:hypothetical protein [Streptomyces sp. NPDC058371]|uniref:hypothetical protein n=1 Tax=Streptomyces sp. NPDC058371 TaxID=3346463 RepID=UPI003662EBB0
MRGERVGRRSGIEIRMRWQAGEFVRQVTARNRLPLDYSVDSLRVVDFIVDGVRKGEPERVRARQVLYGLGVYVGEVFVRRAGGAWVEFDAQQRELFGQPVGVRMPDGRLWNPLGKVVKRFEAGASESVRMLYLQVHGRAARPLGCGRRTA